jgi:hypothetical protein
MTAYLRLCNDAHRRAREGATYSGKEPGAFVREIENRYWDLIVRLKDQMLDLLDGAPKELDINMPKVFETALKIHAMERKRQMPRLVPAVLAVL